MKYFIFPSILHLLSGCASFYSVTEPESLENVAIVVSGKSKAQDGKLDFVGIYGADGDFINGVRTLYLSPGKHTIGYMCPGWVFLDYAPETPVEVIAGKKYELLCNSETNMAWIEEL